MASRIQPKPNPLSEDPVVGHITQFIEHVDECFGYYNAFLRESETLALQQKRLTVDPALVLEIADWNAKYYVHRDAALGVGRVLTVELEGLDFNTTELLRFLHRLYSAYGAEEAAPLWADLKVSLERFKIRRAIGEGKPDDAATKPRPLRHKWLAAAMFCVKENPNLSARKIAKAVGISPAQLTRSPEYQRAAALARSSKQALPRGSKNGLTGELEAEADAREKD